MIDWTKVRTVADKFAEAKAAKLTEIKGAFAQNVKQGVCTLSLGWPIDCRRDAGQDDVGNMEGLLRIMDHNGLTDADTTQIRGADNVLYSVTKAQLRDAIIPEMIQYGQSLYQKKWNLEEQAEAATTDAELEAIGW